MSSHTNSPPDDSPEEKPKRRSRSDPRGERRWQREPECSVKVESIDDRLRLRWSWAKSLGGTGKRFQLALGLPDTLTNRKLAESKAKEIESDLFNRHFDPSLEKYAGKSTRGSSTLKVVDLFEKFIDYKANVEKVYEDTLFKYRSLHNHLKTFFKNAIVSSVTENRAAEFRDYLAEHIQPITLRERMAMLKACWTWGIEKKLVVGDTATSNPWTTIHKRIKVAPSQGAKPFTKDEIKQIIVAFRTDADYAFYADYVETLLSIGTRTGEINALKWKHLNEDCSVVWIGESVTVRGKRKATKANNAAHVPIPPRIQEILLKRRPPNFDPEGLVFPSPRGKHINQKDFAARAWKTILGKLNIEYRKPYTSRKTFVSHAVYGSGLSVEETARLTRHDPKVLKQYYLDDVGEIRMPDILDD
ncbi:tyrosine-type recombinase/integrase [Leptolyngbya sp. AN03gr2]|uniref:tyrosine-type recombinase/integrase n=1 Tax=unclassified Leptolyngbya TaxID=2650499 RepID=UPI003D31CA20